MELRKLIGFGRTTYSITLPKKWVTDNALTKGDLILIQEKSPEKLEITPRLTKQEELVKEITINVNNKSYERVERELIAAYINDYAIINLSGERRTLENVRKVLNELIGLEIMEISNDKIVTKVFSDVTNTHIDNIIRRISLITNNMFDDLEVIFNGGNHSQALVESDIEINRQSYFATRILTKAIRSSYFRGLIKMELMEAAFALKVIDMQERMADDIKTMGRQICKLSLLAQIKPQHKKAAIAFVKRIRQIHEAVIKAYLIKDKTLANTSMDQILQVRIDLEEYTKAHTDFGVPYVNGNLSLFGAFISDLGLIVFNSEL